MTPIFTVSILAINGLEMTKACVESVLAGSGNFQLILTDNHSTDGTAEYFDSIPKRHKETTVIHNAENKGFGVPNNHALTLAVGKYFVTLNNDCVVPPDWLYDLQDPFAENPNAAQTVCSGTCSGFEKGAKEFLGAHTMALEYAEASCMMAPVEILRKEGFFSPFIRLAYSEDCDLSLRLRAKGYTIHRVPLFVKHIRAATAKQVPGLREAQAENHAFLLRRWGSYLKHRRLDLPIIVRRDGALGDCLLTTPLISQMKLDNPRSEVFVETRCPQIFRGNPNVAGVAQQFPEHYQWANIVDLNMAYENRPMMNYQDAYAEQAGYVVHDRTPQIYPSDFERNDADERLPGDGCDWLAIHTGPSWFGREWPVDRWASLLTKLRKDWKIVLVGSAYSDALPSCADFRGRLSIHQTAAIIEKCALFIGIDSFPIHIAQAVSTPAVGLFGLSFSHVVLSAGRKAIGVDADPEHPFAGARSKAKGVTKLEVASNPMETITEKMVMQAVRKIMK